MHNYLKTEASYNEDIYRDMRQEIFRKILYKDFTEVLKEKQTAK